MTDAQLRSALGDRYAIQGELGSGGMAIVYRGRISIVALDTGVSAYRAEPRTVSGGRMVSRIQT